MADNVKLEDVKELRESLRKFLSSKETVNKLVEEATDYISDRYVKKLSTGISSRLNDPKMSVEALAGVETFFKSKDITDAADRGLEVAFKSISKSISNRFSDSLKEALPNQINQQLSEAKSSVTDIPKSEPKPELESVIEDKREKEKDKDASINLYKENNDTLKKIASEGIFVEIVDDLKTKQKSKKADTPSGENNGFSLPSLAGLRGSINNSAIGKFVNGVGTHIDKFFGSILTKFGSVLAKVPGMAGAPDMVGKIVEFGLSKVFFLLTAAFDVFTGFKDENAKKLTGGTSFADKLLSGALHMLSGITFGLVSPETIKRGTDAIAHATQPIFDAIAGTIGWIYDHTVGAIVSVVKNTAFAAHVKAAVTTAKQSVKAGKEEYEASRGEGKGVVESTIAGGKAAAGEVQIGSRVQNYNALKAEMEKSGMSENAQAALLANVASESGFKAQSENLNYSRQSNEQIRKTFGGRLKGISDEELTELKKDPTKFGDKVYADLGGSQFRGRGLNQLTGKDNYAKYSKQIFGDDRLVKNPDLVNDPAIAAKVAIAYNKERTTAASKKLYGTTDVNSLSAEQAAEATTKGIAPADKAEYAKREAKTKAILADSSSFEKQLAAQDAKAGIKPTQVAKAETPKPAQVTSAKPIVLAAATPNPTKTSTEKHDEAVKSSRESSVDTSHGKLSLASITMLPQDQGLSMINTGMIV